MRDFLIRQIPELRDVVPALVVVAIITLTGCTAADLREQVDEAELDTGDRLAAWAVVSARDVEAARRAAELADDTRAVQCWEALGPVLDELRAYRVAVEQLEASGSGYALKYQRARNVRRFLQDPPRSLDACRLMADDSTDVLRRLAVSLGIL